jgi:D-xylose transport system permease protein
MWAEVVLGVAACAAILGISAFMNQSFFAQRIADQINAQTGAPAGTPVSAGFPYPVMILVAVTLVMTWLATRRRFGRYVYAYGGNPDAASLAGINTRMTILKTYVIMGILCAISAAIAVGRLNVATLDIGQSYELYVIAAAVVGGTSFAGGIGTIPGAVLGAFVMQSLAYGLAYIGIDSPGQNVAAGVVLILAVALDAWTRRRGTRTTR